MQSDCTATTQIGGRLIFARWLLASLAGWALLISPACQHSQISSLPRAQNSPVIVPIDLSNPAVPIAMQAPLQLAAAKNEWISFVLELRHIPQNDANAPLTLRIDPLTATDQTIDVNNLSAYQILSMPVDTNRAGYVRHTGLPIGAGRLPRALLPLKIEEGEINISSLRDPSRPFDPEARDNSTREPIRIWIDVHVPSAAGAGDYSTNCQLMSQQTILAKLPVSLQVFDFALPDERHLLMASRLDWGNLQRLFPDQFEAITPRLMNRNDAIYAQPINILDQLIDLAQANRTVAAIPRLQPTVKWPAGQPPQFDWSDFDSLVSPWLNGDAFADKTPLAFWPLPTIDRLENYDAKDRQDYWSATATHFNEQEWLERSMAIIPTPSSGKSNADEQLSRQAERMLETHPLLRVMLPLKDDQLRFAKSDDSSLLNSESTDRIISEANGLVFATPAQTWPANLKRPDHWLGADLPGLAPYVGAGGDERDVRLWAWLAFVQHAGLVLWDDPFPRRGPTEPADPNEMVWFYPGQWFGVDGPVPSIQLKWLRRAEQDYEYLSLAEQRGMATNAFMLARLITKQVQLQPGQAPDPEYGLLSGTIDAPTWEQARMLLARTILLRSPEHPTDDPTLKSREIALNLDTIRWQQPKERPYILPRTVQWLWEEPSKTDDDRWVFARLGVDVYNAGDNRPTDNLLQWNLVNPGWEFQPQPVEIGALQTYWVQRYSLEARVDLDRIAGPRKPLEISFVDGYTRDEYHSQVMLPVAVSDRREGNLDIDGKINEWQAADQIHSGRLTKMLDRSSVQRWRTEPASIDSDVYTAWADDNFYVAFRAQGTDDKNSPHRNFVDYQFRRAWGEDLCELLIQPIYDDNTLGPVTYLACKPNGVCMVRRHEADQPWRETDGTMVRYAADISADQWTGEIAIPWKLLLDNSGLPPRLLRFNFIQHRASTGESASWAGPIDFDQDDSLMGLLFLRGDRVGEPR